ncbi:hypothetical protein AMTR_s00001p00246560 [Amborella trichopoda]|uniref:Neutral/alkaline non-lysosomal ceramidase N-terminal domain-containing protein n=1 Tax=Amborella trichopoda TaxID=13333 RepID=W1NMD3_AMBTC|nr:hypothetical protein AMTR_s00001p00246560 [Amborella trichopoda]
MDQAVIEKVKIKLRDTKIKNGNADKHNFDTGDVENAGINRSPSAYLFNPAQERAKYPQDVDPEMTLLKLVDQKTGAPLGAFSWFATHGTSMTKENKLISGDNKGAAARFFEDWFTTHEGPSPTSPSPNPGEVFFFLSLIK